MIVIESYLAKAVAAITSSEPLVNPFLEMVGVIRRAIPPNVEVQFGTVLGKPTLWQVV